MSIALTCYMFSAQVQAKKDERELTISGSRAAPAEAKPRSEGEGSEGSNAQQQAGRRRRIERRFGKFSRTFKVRMGSIFAASIACCISRNAAFVQGLVCMLCF